MAKMRLQVKGFDEMLERVQRAGGNVDKAAKKCMERSVSVLEEYLIDEAAESGVETTEIFHQVTVSGNRISGETGWKLGNYDSNNPSEGYRAMFAEFGTGRHSARSRGKDRETAAGYNRGSTEPRPFMAQARKRAVKPVRTIQQETLQELLQL